MDSVSWQVSMKKVYYLNLKIHGAYAGFLKPLNKMLLSDLRLEGRWHADETRWRMFLDEYGKLWYMWAFRSEKIVDRYSAYKVLAKYGLALLAYCWAHVRRDFINIRKKFPDDLELRGWAEEWVAGIAELYRINNERVKYPKGSEPFLQYDTRLRKALGEMKADSEREYHDDAQVAAMNSMRGHWSGLVLFVEYPELPMDNNLMENGIRPCALGRNNFLGNHSIWGGNLAACMYSIIQTCLLNKINPRDYLRHYFNVCASSGGNMDSEKTRACLPYNLDVETRGKLALKKF